MAETTMTHDARAKLLAFNWTDEQHLYETILEALRTVEREAREQALSDAEKASLDMIEEAIAKATREALERAAKVADKMYVGDGTNESYVYSGNVGTEILRLRLALIGETGP